MQNWPDQSSLPNAWGESLLNGVYKASPESFRVNEHLGFELAGEGEHWYLQVRKCALTTQEVVSSLQQRFECGSADIGLSGLKDKFAFTKQWISIRTPKVPTEVLPSSVFKDKHEPAVPGEFAVLQCVQHSKKLRRGAHQHNGFEITLNDLSFIPGKDKAQVESRLYAISSEGFPNYFGVQRFGRHQRNLVLANEMFTRSKKRVSRNQRSLLLSSARALLFNQVCATRVKMNNWASAIDGDVFMLDGTRSFFTVDDHDSSLDERVSAFDIHPTGPMWGRGELPGQQLCLSIEREQTAAFPVLCAGLEKMGLKQERRSLRTKPAQLSWRWEDEKALTLSFDLPAGVFATSLLKELGDFVDAAQAGND